MAVKISLAKNKALDIAGDASAYFFEKDFKEKDLKGLEKVQPNLVKLLKSRQFTGAASSAVLVSANGKSTYVGVVGLGAKKDGKLEIENLRRSIGALVRVCETHSVESLAIELPSADLYKVSEEYLIKQVASTFLIANYKYDKFLSDKSAKEKQLNVTIANCDAKLKPALEEGVMVGDCVNDARLWIDSPPNILKPRTLADEAVKIAKKYKLDYKLFNEEEIKKMGMGGLAAVSSGSAEECRFVVIEYRTKKKSAPHLAFVGKGITFDSGGLSLKPADYMETMKEDMSGAAAVISSMQAIAQLKPDINITAFVPIAENTPSGDSDKPGDIVTFYNGKTAEIINTDAEGRLILADALSYANKHYKLDGMIDLATLTGACQYALGPFYSGLFSEHDDIAKKAEVAANLSGDYVWRLPLNDDYKKANRCAVADLSNCGSRVYKAGATTAAAFLQAFVGDTPWVHVDIAGTAFNVPDIQYYRPSSATGVGVRLLIEFALNWK